MAGNGEAKGTRKRAKGRTLVEFKPLEPAERKLLEACRIGEPALIAGERPKEKTTDNSIRPAFLRFLALGGDDKAPLHEKGVELHGARIDGDIDFECCRIDCEIKLFNCTIAGKLNIRSTDLRGLFLDGSIVRGINGDGLRCRGDLRLGNGFHATSEVSLAGAHIHGSFDCTGGRFEVNAGSALSCDGIKIGGAVFLDELHATGEVRLVGARIGGHLECTKGCFDGAGGRALICDNIEVDGTAFLNNGFRAIGEVRLVGARIGSDLNCQGGRFEARGEYSLLCNRARINGALDFRGIVKPDVGNASVVAFLGAHASTLTDDSASWQSASALVLDGFTYDRIAGVPPTNLPMTVSADPPRASVADPVSIPRTDQPRNTTPDDGPPRDAKIRIAWLDRQLSLHLKKGFRPQPWQQLARVLMETGDEDDARTVLIEMRKRQRDSRWKYYDDRCERRWWFLRTRLDWLIGFFVAYGYRPDRAMYWLFGLWVVGGMIYWSVAQVGIMAPTDAHFYLDPRIPSECKVDWIDYAGPRLPTSDKIAKAPNDASRASLQQQIFTDATRRHYEAGRVGLDATQDWTWKAICNRAVPSEYSVFQPFIYSIDIMLPFLELRQERDFAPRVLDDNGNVIRPLPNWVPLIGGTWGLGYLVRLWEWFEIFFGWTLTILIAASVSGIIKKD